MEIQDNIPERLVIRGLRTIKARARRRDLVGNAAYRTLELVHGGLGATVKSLGRIHDVSEPPARGVARRTTSPARRTARSRSTRGSAAAS
jgi:hypothetical protein